ncbi:MAG: hypothetical protein HRK26_02515 [Rickettsiaceae bacterium H1]|nr:hypothetical protein [Rickettsiaceae bacterium H1]
MSILLRDSNLSGIKWLSTPMNVTLIVDFERVIELLIELLTKLELSPTG